MNVGGLAATLILSALILRLRWTRFHGESAADRATRRGLGLVALILPLAGVALPFVPWPVMAGAILIVTVGSLAIILLSNWHAAATAVDSSRDGRAGSGHAAS